MFVYRYVYVSAQALNGRKTALDLRELDLHVVGSCQNSSSLEEQCGLLPVGHCSSPLGVFTFAIAKGIVFFLSQYVHYSRREKSN